MLDLEGLAKVLNVEAANDAEHDGHDNDGDDHGDEDENGS